MSGALRSPPGSYTPAMVLVDCPPAGATLDIPELDLIVAGPTRGRVCHAVLPEGEAEIMLFAGEVHLAKDTAEARGSFPTDLFAEAGFVAGRFDGSEHAQEVKEDGLKKMPILGATGKESAKP